jgi:hypothetical protein
MLLKVGLKEWTPEELYREPEMTEDKKTKN